MTPAQLAFEHIGQKGTFPLANQGGTVTGTLTRVRHAAQGTYIEIAEELGVYQTDATGTIQGAS